jgi:hypothetical protein
LLINNINGKMLNVIQNIYKDIKSNIIFNNSKSDYFPCDNGGKYLIVFEGLQGFLPLGRCHLHKAIEIC